MQGSTGKQFAKSKKAKLAAAAAQGALLKPLPEDSAEALCSGMQGAILYLKKNFFFR